MASVSPSASVVPVEEPAESSSAAQARSSGATAPVRRTQRAPASCIKCAKRKTRCSRTIPCAQCIKRGEGEQCRRELVLVKGQELRGGERSEDTAGPTSLLELIKENDDLRRQLAGMEGPRRPWGLRTHMRPMPYPRPDARRASSGAPGSHEKTQPANDLEKMAGVMMLLEMGRSREGNDDALSYSKFVHTSRNASLPRPGGMPVIPNLPPRDVSTRLITFVIESLGFAYGTLHGPTFLEELRQFGDAKDEQGPLCRGTTWLSLYASQLALAYHFFPPSASELWGITDQRACAHMWFNTSLQLLWASDFMISPDLTCLHTIAALSCIFPHYGTPSLGSTITATGVRLAQMLRIDQQQEEALCGLALEGSRCSLHNISGPHLQGSPGLLDREVKRRLWWFSLYRDWISLPSGFPHYVAPECVLAPDPLNLSDHQLTAVGALAIPPVSQPTTASFHIVRTRVARISHQFFSTFRCMDRQDPERYDLAFATDAQLEKVIDDMPYFSRDGPTSANEALPWMHIARAHVLSLIAHKRLLLFRDHFTMAFSDSQYSPARDACVARAQEILSLRKDMPHSDLLTAETTVHWAHAANVLALDLIYTPVSRQWTEEERLERISVIEDTLTELKRHESADSHCSRIAGQVGMLLRLDQLVRSGGAASLTGVINTPEPVVMPQTSSIDALLGETFDPTLVPGMTDEAFATLLNDTSQNDSFQWQ